MEKQTKLEITEWNWFAPEEKWVLDETMLKRFKTMCIDFLWCSEVELKFLVELKLF